MSWQRYLAKQKPLHIPREQLLTLLPLSLDLSPSSEAGRPAATVPLMRCSARRVTFYTSVVLGRATVTAGRLTLPRQMLLFALRGKPHAQRAGASFLIISLLLEQQQTLCLFEIALGVRPRELQGHGLAESLVPGLRLGKTLLT